MNAYSLLVGRKPLQWSPLAGGDAVVIGYESQNLTLSVNEKPDTLFYTWTYFNRYSLPPPTIVYPHLFPFKSQIAVVNEIIIPLK